MAAPWSLICLVFALVLFAIGAFGWREPIESYRVKIVSAGLFFYTLSLLVGGRT